MQHQYGHHGKRTSHRKRYVVLGMTLALCSAVFSADRVTAFPGAQGWAASTPGGRGGQIIRVTTLKGQGPGSFAAAVATKGPRIIVFEVGGVIDLQRKEITIREPFVTIAGQSAPSPGITFIRGGINISTHDVIVRHISVRPGEAGAEKKSGWEVDGIATSSYNIIVDHCSCTWATDENLSASGPRFDGETVEDWRKNTSHRVTFSHCIIAEGLSQSTHAKGEHSKGSLIHDNATEIAIIGNLYASNVRRNPYFKGGVRGIVVNNLITNPGRAAMHYGLQSGEWTGHDPVTGQMAIVGNVMEHGLDTPENLPLFVITGRGPVEVCEQDNLALDRSGRGVRIIAADPEKCKRVDTPPLWPDALEVMPAAEVKDAVLAHAGARPWDRSAVDHRIIQGVREGMGRIIHSEQDAGGYPVLKETRARFDPAAWDLATMERKTTEYRIDSQAEFDRLCRATFAPGDRILFKRGQTFNGMFSPSGCGTKQAPITLRAYGRGHRPLIHANGKHAAGLLLKNADFWEINGLEITNTNGSDDDQGTLFGIYVLAQGMEETLEHVYIDDCYIHDVNGKAPGKKRGGIHVHITDSDTAKFHDLRITNNRIERVGGVDIGNTSSCGRIEFLEDKTISHNLWTDVYVAGNFVKDTGRNNVIARCSVNAVYEKNTLVNSSRYSTGHSLFNFNTDGIKMQFNEVYGNVGEGGIDRGAFDADYSSINTFIQYNYSHDNHWFCGIMKRRNRGVVIRYNISQNDKKGIYFYGFDKERKAHDVHIYNNTHFIGKDLDVEVFCEGRTPLNTLFENNIFYFEGKGQWGKHAKGINTTFRNNLYFNIEPHVSETRPVKADPMFVLPGQAGTNIDLNTMASLFGYRLRPGSPCIDAGTAIQASGGRDLLGIAVPESGADLGAFAWGPSYGASKPIEGSIKSFLGDPRMELHPLYGNERFPNIVVTLDGTVLATWGSKDIRVCRSEDGGKTWGEPVTIANPGFHGGGTLVDETSGDILVFVEKMHPPAPLTVFRSQDDGKTWRPEIGMISPDSRGNLPSMHMNEHGITLRHGPHRGRLVRPARYYGKRNDRAEWPNHYTTAIYSDDHGKTWRTSDPFPENGTGEAAVAELSDGRIYYNSRVHWQARPKNTRRRSAWSYDGGQTWKDWQVVDVLPDGHQHRSYGCMGGLVRLPVAGKDILIFSNIDTSQAKRERATVWVSLDGGITWPVKRLVYDGPSAYSSLTAGRPQTASEGWIYLHFEGGPKGGSTVARFNLAWLLGGEPTGNGTVPDEPLQ